jgi:hypothetical protein
VPAGISAEGELNAIKTLKTGIDHRPISEPKRGAPKGVKQSQRPGVFMLVL